MHITLIVYVKWLRDWEQYGGYQMSPASSPSVNNIAVFAGTAAGWPQNNILMAVIELFVLCRKHVSYVWFAN